MDSFILGLRVLVALGAVLGLIWFVQRRLGKGKGRRRADAALTVVSRQVVGQKASVVVVDAGDKRFLLGVTEHAVTVLHSSEAPTVAVAAELAEPTESDTRSSFAELFRQASGEPAARTVQVPASIPAPVTGPLPEVRRRSDIHRGQVHRDSSRDPGRSAPPMHGSILSASTWRQASDALRGRRN